MIKYILINSAILISQLVNAQIETVNKKSNINHLAGIDIGYTSYGNIQYNGEINLNYIFNPHYFCVKSQLGVAPNTDYGNLTKIFVSLGFSTKIDKTFSWHLLTGYGCVIPSQKYYNSTLSVSNFFIETGFYIKPSKTKRHVFGLNTTAIPSTIQYDITNKINGEKGIAFNLNLSYNLKLNK